MIVGCVSFSAISRIRGCRAMVRCSVSSLIKPYFISRLISVRFSSWSHFPNGFFHMPDDGIKERLQRIYCCSSVRFVMRSSFFRCSIINPSENSPSLYNSTSSPEAMSVPQLFSSSSRSDGLIPLANMESADKHTVRVWA